jgi:hypothetical protein
MTTSRSQHTIEISPTRDRRSDAALVLGILAVPGGTLAWDIPFIGGWPFIAGAVIGLVLGVQAWRAGHDRRAVVGAALCTVMILFTAVFLVGAALK